MKYGDNAPKLEKARTALENILIELASVAGEVSKLDLADSEPGGYPSYYDMEGHKSLLNDTVLVRRSIVGMLRAIDIYESNGHFGAVNR